MTVQHDRGLFNLGEAAKGLASQVGVTEPWSGNGSDRFAYFADERRFVIVAGPQEGSYVDLAFAQGLAQRGSRRLVLILPKDHAFATLQRAPWFKAEARPVVYLHDGVTAHVCDLPAQDETVKRLNAKHKGSPEDELRKAATPAHLGARSDAVYDLVEWATKEPLLDASHRRGERSWHCMGQKVLSIKGTTIGLGCGSFRVTDGSGPECVLALRCAGVEPLVLAGEVEGPVFLEVAVADHGAQGEDGFGAV
jgi:hypothetical protein